MLLAEMAFDGQRFHGIGMAGLQNDVDHPVGLVLLHHLAQQLQALMVRGNTGAADGEIFVG